MSAQMDGLALLVTTAREIVPPQLEFVVIVFHPDQPTGISSVMYPSPTRTPRQQLEAARKAAQAFLDQKPHPSFDPQS